MSGPGFTQTFGGSVIYPSRTTDLSLNISVNTSLQWPVEQAAPGNPVVADLMDVSGTVGGLSLSFADATQMSTGYTAMFNNIGANTISLKDVGGNVLGSVGSGQAWILYLADNSTPNGTWRVFQMGTGASSATAGALAGAGLKAITTTINQRYSISTKNADYVILPSDRATCIEWIGGTGNLTSPDPTVAGSDWFCLIKNNGSGNATFTPLSGTIDGTGTLVFGPDTSAFVICDGANFITVGFGQQVNSIFDFISIDVSGGAGDTVLSGAQLNRISYRFTGALTGNRNVVIPTTVQQYWVDNETTGAFTLTVKTAGGAGSSVVQGGRNILYCDGVNVVPAITFGSTGFTAGSAAAPSLFFAADPDTGIYSAGANNLDFATGGARRGNISSNGGWTIFGPTAATTAFTVNGSVISGAPTALIVTPFGSTAVNPILSLQSSAANGFAQFSLLGNASVGVLGTDDFGLLQNGVNYDGTIINRHSGANLNLVTTGAGIIQGNGVNLVPLTGSVTIDFGSIAAGGLSATNVAVAGAALGDPVDVGVTISVSGLTPYAQVTGANQVSVGFQNVTSGAIDPASATFKVRVWK